MESANKVNVLFSIDDGYVEQLKATLYSLWLNASRRDLAIYVMQQPRLAKSEELEDFCREIGIDYHPIVIAEDAFSEAPTTDRYPQTIYYRLLAHEYLPVNLKKILYLDADILCINDMIPLYEMDLGDKLYAAASHTSDSTVKDVVNKIRLGDYESESYFNSGVLLMNLTAIRKTVKRDDIISYIEDRGRRLFLPDQDVLTALYGHHIQLIPDDIYNFDTRYNLIYLTKSGGKIDLDWVIKNTVFLHFCGRDKPWKKNHRSTFAGLYKHYQVMVKRVTLAKWISN